MTKAAWLSVLVAIAMVGSWALAPLALASTAPSSGQTKCIQNGQPVTCPSSGLPPPPTGASSGGPQVMCKQGDSTASCPSFSDVRPGYWALPAIMALAARGVVKGFSNGTFQPNAAVTWGQFAKMVTVALGSSTGSGAPPVPGLDQSAWYAPYVNRLESMLPAQIDARVQPQAAMDREAVAAVVGTVKGSTAAPAVRLPFSDAASIDAWALPGVEQAYAAGFIHGFPDGTFRPHDDLTRAQAAVVLAAVLGIQLPTVPATSGSGSSGG